MFFEDLHWFWAIVTMFAHAAKSPLLLGSVATTANQGDEVN